MLIMEYVWQEMNSQFLKLMWKQQICVSKIQGSYMGWITVEMYPVETVQSQVHSHNHIYFWSV